MTTAVQHRRGTTTEHSVFTGLEGELTIDTTKDTAVIHDGALQGGYPLAKENLVNVNPTTLASIDGASTAADDQMVIYDTSVGVMKKISRAELNNAIVIDALDNVDINGGTIDGTVIGATTRAAGNFTTLNANGNVTLGDASTDTVTVNGYMGVGGAAASTVGLRVVPTALTSTGQVGIGADPLITSASTVSGTGLYGRVRTEAAAFTVTTASALLVYDATKGAGSTITNQHGLYVSNQTQGTNNFGITSLVSSGTNKWNIYASGTAANYFAGNVQFAAGTAAAPALTRFGDTNTGIFFPAADTLAASTAGSERLRITSAGNVGIGTSSPDADLHVETAGASYVRVSGNRGNGNDLHIGNIEFGNSFGSTGVIAEIRAITGSSGTQSSKGQLAFYTDDGSSYAERMRIDSSGNVGIGTSSPDANLTVNGAASFAAGTALLPSIARAGDTNTGIFFPAADTLAASTAGSERARIDSSGNLLVGLTSATGVAKLQVSGPIRTTGYTVATLPAGTVGMRTYVTDALAPSFGVTVAGSGAVTIPVFYDGANWIVA
jgi:hypothetical protein